MSNQNEELSCCELNWTSFPNFLVGGIQYNADSIIATLTVASLVNEPFPAHTFTPSYFPGLF